MATRNSRDGVALGDGDDEPSDGVFRLAVAVYAGTLVAAVVSVTAAATAFGPGPLPAVYAAGFVGGCLAGFGAASADPRLPSRFGRTSLRRFALVAPSLPVFVVWFALLDSTVGIVVVWSAIAVFAAGYVLSQLAGNRYVDSVTPDDADETWSWQPSGSAIADAVLAFLWGLLGIGNVVVGNPVEGLVWSTIAAGWFASGLAEGRWSFGPRRDRCEVRLYHDGLVTRRPYTKAFVPWSDVDHARLREGELVLDRGLRDVRFDREELEDPDALLEAIDRRIAATASD